MKNMMTEMTSRMISPRPSRFATSPRMSPIFPSCCFCLPPCSGGPFSAQAHSVLCLRSRFVFWYLRVRPDWRNRGQDRPATGSERPGPVEGPGRIRASGREPPAARGAGAITAPACRDILAALHTLATGIDPVVEERDQRTAVIAHQQAHLAIHLGAQAVVKLALGLKQQLVEALVLPAALVPGGVVLVGQREHHVRRRARPPGDGTERLFQPHIGIVAIVRLAHDID